MPRRNSRKPLPQMQGATIYDNGFRAECYGCAFAGRNSKCLAADGCLLSTPEKKEGGHAPNTTGTNRAGTQR